MCSLLRHRGPDHEGVFVKGNIGLGHTRLSILDLSPAGHQPMCNEDRSVWVVFNGEIYNFPELRDGLEKQGHIFSSHTDTEVIVHLYEEKGIECLHDLRGMFAFALWDENRQRLVLARDRLGKKPLVYRLGSRGLVFASELKALLCDPGIRPEIDLSSLYHYLTYSYVPGPRTIFKNINKLPPAHYLVYENGSATTRRYWSLSYRQKISCRSLEEYKERFFAVFNEAVQCRLKSDVPFGAFLSGGIDSSIIVAVMSGMLDNPVKTFSIGFEEEEYDELRFARMIAERYGTDHHEFIVKPDMIDVLPKLIWHYNEPYADSSAVPSYCLAQMTREHVTMALNGDGSDECFAGYPRYVEAMRASLLQKAAGLYGKNLVTGAAALLPGGSHYGSFPRRLRRYIAAVCEKPERRYVRWLCHFDNNMKQELCSDDLRQSLHSTDSVDLIEALFEQADGATLLDKTLFVDVMSYLPEDLLVKIDIATMAHSLEARSPFIDHKVMEFAASVPSELKLRGGQTKYLLKHILGDYLPGEVLFRKKMGFGLPIDRWLRRELKEMAYDVLLDATAINRGYFKRHAIQELLDNHSLGSVNHCYRIWNLLCLELWHRTFMDKEVTALVS